ncbi:MAG: HU family DNA-binding protein [Heliobacteriaceae bacterium]|jgi:predicted histone-like DNA-binding protein|nr:HU family DNA-binding protein [Heliobacteriaceae bacterium]
MALFYKKVLRVNPSNPTAPKRWYPLLKSIGLVKEREVAKLLADETTLNPKEAEMTLFQLLKVIVRLLLDGHTVQLGELGSFHLTARGEGSDTEEEVNAGKIKSVHLNFTPSKELRKEIENATFKDISTIQ